VERCREREPEARGAPSIDHVISKEGSHVADIVADLIGNWNRSRMEGK